MIQRHYHTIVLSFVGTIIQSTPGVKICGGGISCKSNDAVICAFARQQALNLPGS
jgi:hypothetical protein